MAYDEQSFLNGLAAGLTVTGGNKTQSGRLTDSFYGFDISSYSDSAIWGVSFSDGAVVMPIRFYTISRPCDMRLRISCYGDGLFYNSSDGSPRTDSEIQQFIPDYPAMPHAPRYSYSANGRSSRFYLNLKCASKIQTAYIMILCGSSSLGYRVLEAPEGCVLESYNPIIFGIPRGQSKLATWSWLVYHDYGETRDYRLQPTGWYNGFENLIQNAPIEDIYGHRYVSYNGDMYFENYAFHPLNPNTRLHRKMSTGLADYWRRAL